MVWTDRTAEPGPSPDEGKGFLTWWSEVFRRRMLGAETLNREVLARAGDGR